MRLSRYLTVALLALAPAHRVLAADESPEVYQLAAVAAASVLPEPLQSFFQNHLSAWQSAATAGLDGAGASLRPLGQPDWHYVMLDMAAGATDPAKRRDAARSFPRDRNEAKILFRLHDRRDGGRLPWVITEQVRALTQSFQGDDAAAMVRNAGMLLHFSTDAALPFQTTIDRDGDGSGNPSWSARGGESRTGRASRTVRTRCQIGLFHTLNDRIAFEMRISPTRATSLTNPLDAVFETLLDAHDRLERFVRADREITTRLAAVDAATFEAVETEYYRHLSRRVGSDLEACIESAGLLAARLISHAWEQAGRPPLPQDLQQTKAAPQEMGEPPAGEPRLVGSRGSKVVHWVTCSHAGRIKPENRVYFASPEAADRVGRVPCKACRAGR